MGETKKNILLVDDNTANRKLLATILQGEGYTTSEASDGAEALELLAKTKVDAIISDILMPTMDGYRFCHKVRRSSKHSTLPFIFLTATYTSPSDEKNALDLGADKVLRIPLSPTETLEAVREMFSNPLYRKPRAIVPIKESEVIKQYANRLVPKLDEKIIELRIRTEELKTSEELFRLITENAADLIAVLDLEGRRLYNSLSYKAFFGDPDKLRGTDSFREIHPDDREDVKRIFRETVATGIGQRTEFRFKLPDESIRYIESHGSVVRDRDGEPVRVVVVSRDVTERKGAEAEIKKLNAGLETRVIERTAQLQAANEELEAFSYSVSHDLRAPLRAIDGFSRIILEEHASVLNEEVRRLLSVIRENTLRMGQLIDDLLALSRVGRSQLSLSRVSMTKLARAAFEELVPPAERQQGEFTVSDLPNAYGDEDLIKQVWTNLISNAWKFSRTQERRVVNIGGRAEGGECVYFVKDNGVGFDETYKHKLFGVFQRLHTTKEFEGTGVGLAIVQRIVARHGGRVWAEGRVKEGATFYFTLPVKEGDA